MVHMQAMIILQVPVVVMLAGLDITVQLLLHLPILSQYLALKELIIPFLHNHR